MCRHVRHGKGLVASSKTLLDWWSGGCLLYSLLYFSSGTSWFFVYMYWKKTDSTDIWYIFQLVSHPRAIPRVTGSDSYANTRLLWSRSPTVNVNTFLEQIWREVLSESIHTVSTESQGWKSSQSSNWHLLCRLSFEWGQGMRRPKCLTARAV